MSAQYEVRLADWDRDRELIRSIREQVFVIEQQVDPELEWDGEDAASTHVLAGLAGQPLVATGRLQASGKIGRMAVLAPWRGRGLGGVILRQLVDIARDAGLGQVYLHAQTHAEEFYRRAGFIATGPEFDEAGIPHRLMQHSLETR